MPSPRTDTTLGFLRRLDVRLVLALSSMALVALLVSGVALSQILTGYFVQQAENQLLAAANSTESLIQDAILNADEGSPDLYTRELRNDTYIRPAATIAANQIARATVTVRYAVDGSLAVQITPDTQQFEKQGLALDPDVGPRGVEFSVDIGQDEPLAPHGQLALSVTVSDAYTSRAATLAQVRGTLVAAGIIALAGSILLGLLVARQLTSPLNRLRRVSRRLAQGELEERVPPFGVVEIDQLGSQFNVMADRLSESLRLLEADRDRLREFVADVSHELRTPIAALRTFTELQRDGSVDEATRQEFLARSSEQLRRLEWLSTNLLDLSRIEAGIFPLDIREGDLREPLRAVVEAHADVAERRSVTLTSAVPSEPVVLRFDRERIVQLVSNLVENALKFTQPGGEVALTVSDLPDEAVIKVRDSGPGIPESEMPRIFERFYRGTNVGEARASGSGLGLAIARSIVEMHGGSIEVASVVGSGTVFGVHLPRSREPLMTEPVDGSPVQRAGNRPETEGARGGLKA
jgi:signal transduction histidine kinase